MIRLAQEHLQLAEGDVECPGRSRAVVNRGGNPVLASLAGAWVIYVAGMRVMVELHPACDEEHRVRDLELTLLGQLKPGQRGLVRIYHYRPENRVGVVGEIVPAQRRRQCPRNKSRKSRR